MTISQYLRKQSMFLKSWHVWHVWHGKCHWDEASPAVTPATTIANLTPEIPGVIEHHQFLSSSHGNAINPPINWCHPAFNKGYNCWILLASMDTFWKAFVLGVQPSWAELSAQLRSISTSSWRFQLGDGSRSQGGSVVEAAWFADRVKQITGTVLSTFRLH